LAAAKPGWLDRVPHTTLASASRGHLATQSRPTMEPLVVSS